MLVKYETVIRGTCPVNDEKDFYTVVFAANKIIPVENILRIIDEIVFPSFQEEVTVYLAYRLGCSVTTTGYHSGVKTTCTVG